MELTLSATLRENVGKEQAHKLRRMGDIPGVLYGEGKATEHLTIDGREFERVLLKGGAGKLIELTIAKAKKEEREPVLIKEYQRHPVKRSVLHVDFLRVALDRPVTVKVLVHLTNEEKRQRDGAVVQMLIHELEVSCLPTNIPEKILVDVGSLTLGATIHVKDLHLPEGVRVLNPPEEPIVLAAAPTVNEEPAAEPGAAAPETAEQAEA